MKLTCRCLSRRVCCFSPFVGSFINATVTPFFYLFSEKGKDKLYDKSTVLHVRWQKFVYQVLASQGESESRRRCCRRVRMFMFRDCDLIWVVGRC